MLRVGVSVITCGSGWRIRALELATRREIPLGFVYWEKARAAAMADAQAMIAASPGKVVWYKEESLDVRV